MAFRIETGVRLTPKIAEKWLETVKRNRNIHDEKVAEYVAQIKAGKWVGNNGTTMSFDTNGEFRDGQHRAWAVVNSGVAITVSVAYDIDPDSVRTIDIGARRTGGDTLVMETKCGTGDAMRHPKVIATALNLISAFLDYGDIYKGVYLSNDEIWKKYNEHKGISDSAELICSKKILASKSVCVALHYIFTRVDAHRVLANEFFERFINGDNLPAKSPILALRNKFILVRNDSKATLGTNFVISCIIKAWHAWAQGKELKTFTFNPDVLPQPLKKMTIGRNVNGHKIVRTAYQEE